VRDTEVDQPSLLLARDDLDRVAQAALGPFAELAAVPGTAQRVRPDGADVRRVEPSQALAQARQTVQCPLLSRLVEPALGIEAGGDAHRLADAIDHHQVLLDRAGDDHVKAVRAEIDRGDGQGGLGGAQRRCLS
jgi:hypothetical protein